MTEPKQRYYPASYPTVIGVGAADGSAPASFSQRCGVSVLAQGSELEVLSIRNGQNTQRESGSSYSCAIVSGICAKLIAGHPEKTPAEIRSMLFESAADICTVGFDEDSGWGLVRTAAEKERQPFLDVEPSAWYFDAVGSVYRLGIMNGVGGERFSPEQFISRGAFVTVLHRMAGCPMSQYSDFKDVSKEAYYAQAVGWASQIGIVQGINAEEFCPEAPVTREQLITMLYRLYMSYDTDLFLVDAKQQYSYADRAEVSPFAEAAMVWALQNDLLPLRNGLLEPRAEATRAETATLLAAIKPQ